MSRGLASRAVFPSQRPQGQSTHSTSLLGSNLGTKVKISSSLINVVPGHKIRLFFFLVECCKLSDMLLLPGVSLLWRKRVPRFPWGLAVEMCTGDLISNLHLRMLHVDPGPPTGAVCDINQHF